MGTNSYVTKLKARLDQAITQRDHWKQLAENRNSIVVTEVCPESRSVEEYIIDADSVRASWRLIRGYREQIEALRAALLGIASVNPAERGIEWAKSYASDGLKGAGSELYARWLDTFKEAEALRTELAQAHGRADYWKQRAKSAEGHLWSSDAYAGARALQRYTRFEGTPWDELTGQQQAIIAAGACAVIAEVNARREIRKPTDAALEAENALLRAELEQSRDLIVEMSKHCNATALVADWLERNT